MTKLLDQVKAYDTSSSYVHCTDPSRRVQKPVYRSIAKLMQIINNHPELLNPQYTFDDDDPIDIYDFETPVGDRLDYIDSVADMVDNNEGERVDNQSPKVDVQEQSEPETQPENIPD